MKTAAFAIALLMSSAAFAQTTTTTQPDVDLDVGTQPDGDLDVDADVDMVTTTHSDTMAYSTTTATAAGAQVVQPSNASPERDARGIRVISAAAMVPAGWNGSTGTAMGGPLLDPATGEAMAQASYPACTASVTDNCLQTYERGRH